MPPVGKIPDKEETFDIKAQTIYKWPSDKKVILYFTNWGVYGRNFQVKDLPADHITGINYAFYDLKQNSSQMYVPVSGDSWADTDQRYTTADKGLMPLDSWNEENPFYGNFGQIKKLIDSGKKINVGLSIGGWSWSKNFSPSVASPKSREAFADEVISIFKKYPIFNRIDIDWEYPSKGKDYGLAGNVTSVNDPDNLALFLALMRSKLDGNGMKGYEITMCTTADPKKMDDLPIKAMVQYLDTINIMTYDFADGNWGVKRATHQTNVYKTDYTEFSVEEAVNKMKSLGVPTNKIIIGVAYYSRGFSNTDGLAKPASGGSPDTSWEKGIVDYKDLPKPGATEYYDEKAGGGYSYDPATKVFNSYDTIRSVQEKCNFIIKNNLKGIIVWEASGDSPVGSKRNLTKTIYDSLYNAKITNPPLVTPPIPLPLPGPLPLPVNSKIEPKPPAIKEPKPIPSMPTIPSTPAPVNTKPQWKAIYNYKRGDLVSYNNKIYECITQHTSMNTWEPDKTPSLWKYAGDLGDEKISIPGPKPVPTPVPVPTQPQVPDSKPIGYKCPYLEGKIKSLSIKGDIDIEDIKFNYN